MERAVSCTWGGGGVQGSLAELVSKPGSGPAPALTEAVYVPSEPPFPPGLETDDPHRGLPHSITR